MELAYVFAAPAELLEEAAESGAGYSITADCWRHERRRKQWGCDLTWETEDPESTLACAGRGRAWMTRRALRTWMSQRVTCTA